MAGKIRGITIELSGDTKGLVQSLNTASKATKDVQKALKDVNKVLKLDPRSTELLTQKQKLLKENVEAVKTQLKSEEDALRQLQNAADADKTVAQQEALQRQIAETKSKLKDAEGELKNFGSVGAQQVAAMGEKFKELGGKITAVGMELTKKVTGPILALGGASIAAFKDVDNGLDTIIKKTGATGDAAAEMEEIFNNIAGTLPASFDEIGSSVGEVSTRFDVTGKELEDLSSTFIKFAQLNNTDVSSAIESTQKALAAFGLSAEDAGGFLDTVNKVAQNTGINVNTLLGGVQQNAAAFQEMGLSIEQAAIFMGQVETSGADAGTVMSSLSRALKSAAADGIPLDKALSDLQKTITEGTDGMDGLQASYELFGKSGAQVFNAVRNGAIDFTNLKNASLDAGGSIEETFEGTLDPIDDFQVAMQKLKLAGGELGKEIQAALVPAIKKVSEAIGKVLDWWKKLSPETKQTVIKVGAIVAAIGPLVAIIGKVISVAGTIMTLAPKIGAVISALTGPIGLVVAAVAGAIAIGVALYKNWDTIKEKATQIWENVKQTFINAKEAISNAVTNMKQAVVEKFEEIKNRLAEIGQNIKNGLVEKFEGIKSTVTAAWEGLKNTTSSVWSAIKGTIEENGGGIKGIISSAIEGYKNIWSAGFDFINNLTGGKFGEILNKIIEIGGKIKDAITSPFETAKTLVQNAIEKIKGIFPLDIGNIFSGIKLPHFKISGGKAPWGIGGYGTKPSISIEWYKKAMAQGIRLDGAQIFGFNKAGQPMGGGEAGAEWIIGERSLQSMIQRATTQAQIDPSQIYAAVKAGAEAAVLRGYISPQEVARAVNSQNTAWQGQSARFKGAY